MVAGLGGHLAYYGNALAGGKGQHRRPGAVCLWAAVFQQHRPLAQHLHRQGVVAGIVAEARAAARRLGALLRGAHPGGLYRGPGGGGRPGAAVNKPQQVEAGGIQRILGQKTALHRLHNGVVVHPAAGGHLQVAAGGKAGGAVVHGAPVTYYRAGKAKAQAQYIGKQAAVFGGPGAVYLVIAGHHRVRLGLAHRYLEGL